MVSDHKIEIPVPFVSPTFQVRRKRGRPAVSGQNAEVGDVEEEKRKKVHDEGYEVPRLTIRMETRIIRTSSSHHSSICITSRTDARQVDGCVAQRKGMELAVPERDTRSKYSDDGHNKQKWGAGLVVATSGSREVGGARVRRIGEKRGEVGEKKGVLERSGDFPEKMGGLEKVGGGKEKRRWSLETICTHTHMRRLQRSRLRVVRQARSLRAALRVGTGAEERLAAGVLGSGWKGGGMGRVGAWGDGPGGVWRPGGGVGGRGRMGCGSGQVAGGTTGRLGGGGGGGAGGPGGGGMV